MASDARKAAVRRYVAAFNRGDVEGARAWLAPGAVVFGVLGWGEIAKARPIWEQLLRSFAMQLQVFYS